MEFPGGPHFSQGHGKAFRFYGERNGEPVEALEQKSDIIDLHFQRITLH
jgi:hypothetical protein